MIWIIWIILTPFRRKITLAERSLFLWQRTPVSHGSSLADIGRHFFFNSGKWLRVRVFFHQFYKARHFCVFEFPSKQGITLKGAGMGVGANCFI